MSPAVEPYPLPAPLPCRRCAVATREPVGICFGCQQQIQREAELMARRGKVEPIDEREYR